MCDLNEIVEQHKKEFGVEPERVISIPRPTVLLGNFASAYGGRSLMCTTSDGLILSFSRRPDNMVRVVNYIKQDKKRFSVSSLKYRREDKWANGVKAMLLEMNREHFQLQGMNISLMGIVASSEGSTLSSSVFIGTALGFSSLYGYSISNEKIFEMALKASTFSEETETYSGDIWTLLYAKEGYVHLYDQVTKTAEYIQYESNDGISHTLLNSSLPYSVLTPEKREFLTLAKNVVKAVSSRLLRGVSFTTLNEKTIKGYITAFSDSEKRMAQYLVIENYYTLKASEAIKNKDWKNFGNILSSVQKALVSNVEYSSPELDWIFRRSSETADVYGMTLVGLGISGTFLCIFNSSLDQKEHSARIDEYERIFGFRLKWAKFVPTGITTILM